MSGCNDPGTGEAAEVGFRSRVVHGGVGGAGGGRDPGDGDRTGNESVAVVVQPRKIASQQPGRHTAAQTLPGD